MKRDNIKNLPTFDLNIDESISIKDFFAEVKRVNNLKKLKKTIESKKIATHKPLSIIIIYASSITTPYDPKSYIHLYYCIITLQASNIQRALRLLVKESFTKLLWVYHNGNDKK